MHEYKNWLDHITENTNRFNLVTNEDGTVSLMPVAGEVYQQGTPQSATNFNNMEDGIFNAQESAALAHFQKLHEKSIVKNQVNELLADRITYVTPEIFGAVGDGVTDDTQAFVKLADSVKGSMSVEIVLGKGKTYLFDDNTILDFSNCVNLVINGKKSTLKNVHIKFNITDSFTTYKSGIEYGFYLNSVKINCNNSDIPFLITATTTIRLNDISAIRYNKLIAVPNTIYLDRFTIRDSHFYYNAETNEATVICGIDENGNYTNWTGSGDMWDFSNCTWSEFATINNPKPMFTIGKSSNPITFRNCLHPQIAYTKANNYLAASIIKFDGCHFENNGEVLICLDAPTGSHSSYTIDVRPIVEFNTCFFLSWTKLDYRDTYINCRFHAQALSEHPDLERRGLDCRLVIQTSKYPNEFSASGVISMKTFVNDVLQDYMLVNEPVLQCSNPSSITYMYLTEKFDDVEDIYYGYAIVKDLSALNNKELSWKYMKGEMSPTLKVSRMSVVAHGVGGRYILIYRYTNTFGYQFAITIDNRNSNESQANSAGHLYLYDGKKTINGLWQWKNVSDTFSLPSDVTDDTYIPTFLFPSDFKTFVESN